MIKGLLEGLLMGSGMLVHRILYGKNAKAVKDGRTILGYALLNMAWIGALIGAIFGGEIPVLQILSIILSIAYPTTLTILGRKHRENITQRDLCAATQNDEPIVDVVSEADAEITTPKKSKKKMPTVLSKVSSFVLTYKKVFLILTIISTALFVILLIPYNVLDAYMMKLSAHYRETQEISYDPYYKLYGCGLTSCSYCKGQIIICPGTFSQYSIEKYSFLSDVRDLIVGCAVVVALLAIISLTALIINFVHHRRNSPKAEVLQDI